MPVSERLSRRRLATSVAVLTAATLGVTGDPVAPSPASGAVVASHSTPSRASRHDDGTASLDLPVVARAQPIGRRRSTAPLVTRRTNTSPFTMAGLTWEGSMATVRLRVRHGDTWGPWHTTDGLDDGPDVGSAEGDPDQHGIDLQWVGRSDGVQAAVRGRDVRSPVLHLIDTVDRPAATTARDSPHQHRHQHRHRRHHRGLRPRLHSRSDWGADPALRSGTPSYDRTLQQVHVHHTVNSNAYSRADVPGLLRGIYRYHTQTLGWSDIGYNFLVDRFGRIWVGRAGGAGRPVLGAHTLGFNSTSTGVAVIGDFQVARPPRAVIKAIARLAAWKLAGYHRNPQGRVWVYSHGSDKAPAGRFVRLPTIDGHRDTRATACPGIHLYRRLPDIRTRARHRIQRFLEEHRHRH